MLQNKLAIDKHQNVFQPLLLKFKVLFWGVSSIATIKLQWRWHHSSFKYL
jgi:hypothetical protein